MKYARFAFPLLLISGLATFSSVAFATTPVVTVTSPANGSEDASPVNFTASASSPDCSAGIAAMRIYTSPGNGVYTTDADHLDVNLTLAAGSYDTVVQAWDNCGGVGKTPVNITVTGSALPPPRFLYSSANANLVYEYNVDPSTGAITPTSQGTVATGSQPGRIASDQGGFRLYVLDLGSSDVSAYFINRDDGSLQPVPGSPFAVTGIPDAVVVHPSGDFIYVTSYVSSTENYVYAFAVQSNGSLLPVSGSPYPTGNDPAAAVIDPTGSFLYVSAFIADSINAYSIDKSNGTLTTVPGEPFALPGVTAPALGAFDLAIVPGGKQLLAPEENSGAIAVFNINSTTGALTNAPNSPVVDPRQVPEEPEDITSISVDPMNRWWYLYESIPEELPSGDIATLMPQGGTPERTGQQCGDLVRADPSGKFVYALGNTDGSGACENSAGAILGYSVNQSNGTLTPLPGFPYASPTPDNPLGGDGLVVTQ
jgi:6-phosphogluconolactonase (cycloisomerase 2 family)